MFQKFLLAPVALLLLATNYLVTNESLLTSVFWESVHPGQEISLPLPELGKSVERDLTGEDAHAYRFAADEGEFLRILIEQADANASATLLSEGGARLAVAQDIGNRKGEIPFLAPFKGGYILELRLTRKAANSGHYVLKLVEQRQAEPEDRLLASKWLVQEAARLRGARRFEDAISMETRAVVILEKERGPEHVDFAGALEELAGTYYASGDYQKAESTLKQVIAIREKQPEAQAPALAFSLNALALTYQGSGDYAQAEPLFERALNIRVKIHGPDHLNVADVLNNFATNCRNKGDYEQAESLYRRALEIRQKSLKADDGRVAQSLNNLAALYFDKGDYLKAERLYQQVLNLREMGPEPEGRATALALSNLATSYQELGETLMAAPLYDRAIAIYEKLNDLDNTELARALNNRAIMTLLNGDLEKAEPMYRRALEVRQKVLGPQHPDVAKSLDSFAVYYDLKGDLPQAIQMRTRSLNIRERNLEAVIVTGSEEQKNAYLSQPALADEFNIALTLQAQSAPKDADAARMGMNLVLQRKGRTLDAMVNSIGTLRRNLDPEGRALMDRLSAVNTRLATLTLNSRGEIGSSKNQKEVEVLESERRRLESEIGARSTAFRSKLQTATIEAVQPLIPDDAALIEFAIYQPFDRLAKVRSARYGRPRYVAYVLRSTGTPLFVEIGETSQIDRGINAFRAALQDANRSDVTKISRNLGQLIFGPIQPLLGDPDRPRQLLISPDGLLNLLPFGALMDERNQYLIRQYAISYLSNGRDLLRLRLQLAPKSPALIMADPAFGLMPKSSPGDGNKKTNGGKEESNITNLFLVPLPYTAKEAQRIKDLLPQAELVTKEAATKTFVTQVSAPSILHIATHGFFFTDEPSQARNNNLATLRGVQWAAKIKQPLLRSGLAFAGFNQHRADGDNGLLTALEAAGLDLWGTKLVVLSACETGLGEVKNSEGVYGLRRALVLAGAETQVMSLWRVSDYATQDLMTSYYSKMIKGLGRGEALRQVQLEMLQKKGRDHPYYWAGFILSGEWASLDGKR